MIELDGIKFSPEMITLIKDWQTGYLQSSIEELDDVISFIARESRCSSIEEGKKYLDLISNLCGIKEDLKTFKAQ